MDDTSSAEAEREGVIPVEVVYASESDQHTVKLTVRRGTTLIEAIHLSGIAEAFPDQAFDDLKKGIYGKLCADDRVLAARDRIEIYRPLILNAQEARRQRAKKGAG